MQLSVGHTEDHMCIMGDFNLDLLKNDTSKPIKQICNLFQMQNMVLELTRITEHSRTLIDLILTNYPERISECGVLPSGILYFVFEKRFVNLKVNQNVLLYGLFGILMNKHFRMTWKQLMMLMMLGSCLKIVLHPFVINMPLLSPFGLKGVMDQRGLYFCDSRT